MFSRLKSWVMRLIPNSWAGRLRVWRIHRMVQAYPRRVVEHQYGASRLKVFLSDPLAQGWYDHDWPILPEVRELQDAGLLSPGDLVFDLGAHQAVVAAMLAVAVGPTGRVVAIEASPHNAEAARQNKTLNGLNQLEIVEAAVSDRDGKLVFSEGLNGQIDDQTGSWGQVEVRAITVDQLAQQYGRPDVVFIDIEGAECLALSGAIETLRTAKVFFVEAHVSCGLELLGGSVEKLLAYFSPEQFDLKIRAEEDPHFRPILTNDPLLRDRFFLLAIRKPAYG